MAACPVAEAAHKEKLGIRETTHLYITEEERGELLAKVEEMKRWLAD